MNRLNLKIVSAAFAALAWLAPIAANAQPAAYGKVEQPWYMQGKISGGISVGSSTAATALPAAGQVAAICNTGAVDASLAFGVDNTVTVVLATGTTLKAGSCRSYDLLPFSTLYKYVATISASSTTLTVETGIGTPSFNGSSVVSGTVTANQGTSPWVTSQSAGSAGTFSGSVTNPSSTLTMTSATTAYMAGQLIATSATAGSIVNPSFAIANSAGGAAIPRVRLSSNDATSTAWPGVSIQVDLWTVTPTWTNGDRGTWLPATGTASHLASFSCTMSTPVWGDGYSAECAPTVGNYAGVKLASGTSVFWSLKAVSASGVTGASKVWTLVPELVN